MIRSISSASASSLDSTKKLGFVHLAFEFEFELVGVESSFATASWSFELLVLAFESLGLMSEGDGITTVADCLPVPPSACGWEEAEPELAF